MDGPGQLIAARAVMGVGAAMVFPSTLSLLTNVFTERRERALAIGLWGAVTGVAIALGPIVGGWLLQLSHWRSIFFALSGFIFLVTQYFQFLKGYGPLSTGVRLLPVASAVAISSILGTRLAVRIGTKLVVAAGLASMAAFYLWVTTTTASTSYATIAAQMIVLGTGMGLTSAPATEAIMGVVPKTKAGVGSAVNDATRLLGGTLGVAVIGSVYASLYASRLAGGLPPRLPAPAATDAHGSVGAALTAADQLAQGGHPALAAAVHNAASSAFFDGFHTANFVAAGVAAAGALMALALLPSHPTVSTDDTLAAPAPASPATVAARR